MSSEDQIFIKSSQRVFINFLLAMSNFEKISEKHTKIKNFFIKLKYLVSPIPSKIFS